jgi:hypothetical protein
MATLQHVHPSDAVAAAPPGGDRHTLREPRLSLGRLDNSLGPSSAAFSGGGSFVGQGSPGAMRRALPPAPSHTAAANLLGAVRHRSLRRECGSYSSAALMLAWTSPLESGLVNRGHVKPQSPHVQNSTPGPGSPRSRSRTSRPLHAGHSSPVTVSLLPPQPMFVRSTGCSHFACFEQLPIPYGQRMSSQTPAARFLPWSFRCREGR